MNMLTTGERRDGILSFLKRGGYLHGYIMARYYGVSERTIRRDMVALRKAGNRISLGTVNGYILRQERKK